VRSEVAKERSGPGQRRRRAGKKRRRARQPADVPLAALQGEQPLRSFSELKMLWDAAHRRRS